MSDIFTKTSSELKFTSFFPAVFVCFVINFFKQKFPILTNLHLLIKSSHIYSNTHTHTADQRTALSK